MIVCQGHACARVMDWGSDESILGRWSWIRLRGSNGRTLRVISVYRPVISTGATTAYLQHRSVLLEQGIDECPRKKLMTDLKESLEKWIKEGDQLIVGGDFNEDVRAGLVKSTFEALNLDECIFRQHGPNAPNTFQNGSVPIDGIFGSKGVDILFSGYTSGTWGLPSDHRALWVDIDLYTTFGGISAPLWRPRIRRLKLEDPRTVKAFNLLRQIHFASHDLDSYRVAIEQLRAQDAPVEEWVLLFERLDRLRVQGILEADRRCRKLKCGNVPWSPQVQLCMHRIGYLQACRKKFMFNSGINSRTLQKLFLKTKFENPILTGEEAALLLRAQYNEFNLLKAQATKLRDTFLAELAESKAAAGDGKAESILKQLLLREEQRSVARAVKWALGKPRGGVTAIEAKNDRGEWTIFTDKQTIEQNCIQENIARFTQASHLPIMNEDSIQSIGWFAETDLSDNILKGSTSTAELQQLDPSLQRLIPFLYRPAQVPNVSCIITKDEYIHEWRKGREFTATGLSQVHFGHFKASCHDDLSGIGSLDG